MEENNKEVKGQVGYCVRCKEKREISNPEQTTLKNGRLAVKGNCVVCQTKIFKFIKKDA